MSPVLNAGKKRTTGITSCRRCEAERARFHYAARAMGKPTIVQLYFLRWLRKASAEHARSVASIGVKGLGDPTSLRFEPYTIAGYPLQRLPKNSECP